MAVATGFVHRETLAHIGPFRSFIASVIPDILLEYKTMNRATQVIQPETCTGHWCCTGCDTRTMYQPWKLQIAPCYNICRPLQLHGHDARNVCGDLGHMGHLTGSMYEYRSSMLHRPPCRQRVQITPITPITPGYHGLTLTLALLVGTERYGSDWSDM